MANNMQLVSRMCFWKLSRYRPFPRCKTNESLATLKNKIWEEIERKPSNKKSKEQGLKHIPFTFENDDTRKQLLARSHYIIVKTKWLTQNQRIRAELLFTNYPFYIKHKHTLEFRNIYEETSREPKEK
jgi:hypothetical protein